jgi:kinesin family protein 13
MLCVYTERLQQERQQALEKMGISVQASGIKVEKNKNYLVNLNADPSLNELLVYYLKVFNIFSNFIRCSLSIPCLSENASFLID